MSDLTPEQKLAAEAQVDYFTEVVLKRYGFNHNDLPEILDSLRWIKEHRSFMQRIQTGGTMSLIALLVTAIGSAIWQGAKVMIGGMGR